MIEERKLELTLSAFHSVISECDKLIHGRIQKSLDFFFFFFLSYISFHKVGQGDRNVKKEQKYIYIVYIYIVTENNITSLVLVFIAFPIYRSLCFLHGNDIPSVTKLTLTG